MNQVKGDVFTVASTSTVCSLEVDRVQRDVVVQGPVRPRVITQITDVKVDGLIERTVDGNIGSRPGCIGL